MHGVTTALIAFLLLCVVMPHLIKSRPQYYAAFGLVCLIILLDALGYALGQTSFRVFIYFMIAVLQVGTLCLLFLAGGGISWRDLGGELSHAFEVIRRGGEEKEVIIPLSGQAPRRKAEEEDQPERISLDDEEDDIPPTQPPPSQQRKPDAGSSIPLD